MVRLRFLIDNIPLPRVFSRYYSSHFKATADCQVHWPGSHKYREVARRRTLIHLLLIFRGSRSLVKDCRSRHRFIKAQGDVTSGYSVHVLQLESTSPADAADAAEVLIAALENAAAFSASLLTVDALSQIGPHHLVIDTGTIHPRDSRSNHRILHQNGAGYLDAPVSGGTRGAANGTLTILVGGSRADFERARPMLEILGKPHLLGPNGAGHIAKLVNQAIVAVTIGAVAEGLFLAERAGLDLRQLVGALAGGFVSGLAGFGTGLMALGIWLYVLPPSMAVQVM